MIYYSILTISVAYLIYILVMQATTNLKREKSIEEKRQKWQNALVDEKDETQIRIEAKVFANEPYSYLADSVAAVMIEIGENTRKNVKEEEAKHNETDKV